MAEQSGFFDAHVIDGEYDRVYLAASFAKYFASFIGNGVFAGKSSELVVRQKSAADMSVRVLPGQGWINGYWYENTDELSLAIDIADGVLNRIDIIVLRWNNSERVIRLAVKKGISATNPSAPTVQKDADIFELKLAQIYIKAGATNVTQIDITDTRLDSAVCGFVHGVVEQLDAQEFGEQLTAFINEFMTSHQAWSTQFKANSAAQVNTQVAENQAKIDKLLTDGQTNLDNTAKTGKANLDKVASDGQAAINKVISDGQTNLAKVASDGQTAINNVVSTGTTNINNLIATKTNEVNQVITESQGKFNKLDTDSSAWFNQFKLDSEAEVAELIGQLEGLVNENDLASLNLKITKIIERVVTLESLFVQSESNPDCYYRIAANEETEWVNPPNEPGIEYRTTERWNGKPVYQKLFYVGALPNKTLTGIAVDAHYQKIIFVSGFAIDNENLMHYPFPIIQNGLTPIAVIQGVESDGGDASLVVIQTNEDISHMTGYIFVKYIKE